MNSKRTRFPSSGLAFALAGLMVCLSGCQKQGESSEPSSPASKEEKDCRARCEARRVACMQRLAGEADQGSARARCQAQRAACVNAECKP